MNSSQARWAWLLTAALLALGSVAAGVLLVLAPGGTLEQRLTDGKATVALAGGSPVEEALVAAAAFQQPGVHPLVLDTENGSLSFGLAVQLAERAGARYVRLADLSAQSVAASVQAVAAEAAG